MIPQSSFMVLAPIDPWRETELRGLLASMNDAPGRVNPDNTLFPFAKLEALHVARFLIIDDKTVDDMRVYGITPGNYPLYLAFLGDIDGDANAVLAEAARIAPAGLRTIFSCCEGFSPGTDLLGWMRAHNASSAANYVNWRGRTVRRAREEAIVADALVQHLHDNAPSFSGLPAQQVHDRLRKHVDAERVAGRVTLTPDPPTPIAWTISNLLHAVTGPLLIVLASPVLIVVAGVGLLRLRALEKADPEFCPRVDQQYADGLAEIEDHDVSNQFTAMGSLKPGMLRRWSAMTAFWLIDYAARHVYTHGGLGRVRTIHFARWVFLDGGKRVVFMSNYDGSLESYMDDFINKVGFGLNIAFNGGIGYPRTRWLFLDGCSDERRFKEYLRRHQLPTQVWYKAHPGLTAIDMERNGRIREGLEAPTMNERDARDWVALL